MVDVLAQHGSACSGAGTVATGENRLRRRRDFETGHTFLEHVLPVLQQVDDAVWSVREMPELLSGVLRNSLWNKQSRRPSATRFMAATIREMVHKKG